MRGGQSGGWKQQLDGASPSGRKARGVLWETGTSKQSRKALRNLYFCT